MFGKAHQAMNMPGLSTIDRTRRLFRLQRYIQAAWGSGYHCVSSLTSISKVGGLPKVLVMALLSNIDARLHLLKRHPDLHGQLNEYALDTDDLEFSFSALTKRAGYNAPAYTMLQLNRSIRRLIWLRLDPDSGVSFQHSQHAKYGSVRRRLKRAADWVDCNGQLHKNWRARVSQLAHIAVRDRRHVRGWRKAARMG